MPYRNTDENRVYQREWARRKRLGLPTKIKHIKKLSKINHIKKLSKSELRKRKNERTKKCRIKENKRRKEIREKHLGIKCIICGRKEGKLSAHEIYGVPHTEFSRLKVKEFNNEIKWNNFVLLCHQCHQMAHFVLKYLGISWRELIKRRKSFLVSKGH